MGAVTIASALATEFMGLHYIIGAFVTGAVMPVNLRKPVLDRLQTMTVALLLPFFFTLTGLRTLIDPGSSAFLEILFCYNGGRCRRHHRWDRVVARLVGESGNLPWRWEPCCRPKA